MQSKGIKWVVEKFPLNRQNMCSKCCNIFQAAKILNGIEIGFLIFGLVGQFTTSMKDVGVVASIIVKLLLTGLELFAIIKNHYISLIVFTCIRGLYVLASVGALIF